MDDGSGITGAVQWSLADHEGSVRDIVDDTGDLVEHRDYSAYGEISRFNPDGTPDTVALDFVFAFTGREWDDDIHLANHRARWYAPHAARFINQDPSGFAGGDANLYRYAGNNPVIFVDPSGLCTQGYALGDAWISTSDLWAGLNGGSASGGYTPPVANSTPVNLGFESPFTSLTSTTLDLFPADLDLADADLSLVHNDWGPSGSHALLEPKPIYAPAYQLPDDFLNPRVVKVTKTTGFWDDYDQMMESGYKRGWLEWAGVTLLRPFTPSSEADTVLHYSNGTTTTIMGAGPSTADLGGQALAVTGLGSAVRSGARAAVKHVAEELFDAGVQQTTGVPLPGSAMARGATRGISKVLPGGGSKTLGDAVQYSPGAAAQASKHPGQVAAESDIPSQASVLHRLRAADTPEAHAVAKLIKQGRVRLELLPTDPYGQGAAGRKPWGTNVIEIYTDKAKSAYQATGISAHETKHWLQRITPSTYRKSH